MLRNSSRKRKLLSRDFYARDSREVSKELLGKLLMRKLGDKAIVGRIVETEAYYGERDPASRAYKGKRTRISKWMWMEPGTLFIYMVHANWLLNIVTGKIEEPSAVLIRALEPIPPSDEKLATGPGKLTRYLKVDSSFNGLKVYDPSSPLLIYDDFFNIGEINTSHRVGVPRDLVVHMRFYVKDSKYVSRPLNPKPKELYMLNNSF